MHKRRELSVSVHLCCVKLDVIIEHALRSFRDVDIRSLSAYSSWPLFHDPCPILPFQSNLPTQGLVMYNLNFDVGSRLTSYVLGNVSYPQSFWLHRSVAAF